MPKVNHNPHQAYCFINTGCVCGWTYRSASKPAISTAERLHGQRCALFGMIDQEISHRRAIDGTQNHYVISREQMRYMEEEKRERTALPKKRKKKKAKKPPTNPQ